MSFKTGDAVELISGGPKMTVDGVIGNVDDFSKMQNYAYNAAGHKDGAVLCQWFNENDVKSAIFKASMLKIAG